MSRQKRVVRAYEQIRARFYGNFDLMDETGIALPPINATLLAKWLHDETRRKEVAVLLSGVTLLPTFVASSQPLPTARELLSEPQQPLFPQVCVEAEDRRDTAQVCHYYLIYSKSCHILVH